jgi:probable rRNA maturation factor
MSVAAISYALPRRGLPAAQSFRHWIAAALAGARRRKPAELAVRLVGAAEGRELNRRYRGRDYATNVLSFPADLPPGVDLALLGDLVICAPVVASEAADQGKPLRDHYAHLIIHGVLHLLGYDHETAAGAARMEGMEIRILAGIGVANQYL